MRPALLMSIIVSASTVTGCVSTQVVADRAGAQFVGSNFDAFVLKYGPPRQRYPLNSGDIVYVWNSGAATAGVPGVATTTRSGNTATTLYSGGGSLDLFCEIQFVTAPDGTIKSLSVLKDTIGFWTTSRCNEVLK